MMGKSAFFSEGTAGQMKSAPSFAKDDDSTLPKEPNGSKIGLGPKPIWGMSDKKFKIGQTYGVGLQESLQSISRLEEQLINAKSRVEMVTETERTKELRRAMLDNPAAARLFEIEAPDGRKLKQMALDAETLQKSLTSGYRVTGTIYPSGYVVPLDAPSLFDGLLAAHGDQLIAWLQERGFVILKDVNFRDYIDLSYKKLYAPAP